MQENGYLSPQIFTARLNGNIARRRPGDEMIEY